MPIYEYRCADCGFQEEYLQKVSEPPLTVCPSCGKKKFEKLLSARRVPVEGQRLVRDRLQGRQQAGGEGEPRPTRRADAKADAKAETKTDAKTESKAESKTEAKPEARPRRRRPPPPTIDGLTGLATGPARAGLFVSAEA